MSLSSLYGMVVPYENRISLCNKIYLWEILLWDKKFIMGEFIMGECLLWEHAVHKI